MAPSLRHPPSYLSPAAALKLSKKAPEVLGSSPNSVSASPFNLLLSNSGTADSWMQYENLLLSCLRTGDEESARHCLARLEARFGDENERVMALRGLVKEAAADGNGALEKVLKEYDAILAQNNTNIVCDPYRGTCCVANDWLAYHQTPYCLVAIYGPRLGRGFVADPASRFLTYRYRGLG